MSTPIPHVQRHRCTHDDACRICQLAIEYAEQQRDFPDQDDAPRGWEP